MHNPSSGRLSLRLATLDDIDFVVNSVEQLFSELPYKPRMDRDKVLNLTQRVITGDQNENVIIIAQDSQSDTAGRNQKPVGVLGAALSRPLFCSGNETMAVELLLYVQPEHRNSSALLGLLRAYNFWAKKLRCTYISYASYKNGIEMNRVKRLEY